jgi:hypothetical protein
MTTVREATPPPRDRSPSEQQGRSRTICKSFTLSWQLKRLRHEFLKAKAIAEVKARTRRSNLSPCFGREALTSRRCCLLHVFREPRLDLLQGPVEIDERTVVARSKILSLEFFEEAARSLMKVFGG